MNAFVFCNQPATHGSGIMWPQRERPGVCGGVSSGFLDRVLDGRRIGGSDFGWSHPFGLVA